MEDRKLKGRNKQRGHALILVLIALASGSVIIVPTINYVSTGLIESRISQDALLDQYTADAAIEYTLWQLNYNVDDIVGQLSPENPSYDDSITVNGIEVPITIGITQSPLGDTWPFPVPSSQQGVHLDAALEIESPFLSEDGQEIYFVHKVYIYNSGTSEAHLKAFFQRLDPSFTYVDDSYFGPTANLTQTYVDGHEELYFDFISPRPKMPAVS